MDWLFQLEDRLGAIYNIDEPEGWDALKLKLKRDEQRHGVLVDYQINNLTFTGTSARLIREEYDQYKMAGIMFLHFSLLCNGVPEVTVRKKLLFGMYERVAGSECTVSISLDADEDVMALLNNWDKKVDLTREIGIDNTTVLQHYPNLPETINLPPVGILVKDSVKNGLLQKETFYSGITQGTSQDSFPVLGYFLPSFDTILLSEIGEFYIPNGYGNQAEVMIDNSGPLPHVPADFANWFPSPTNLTGNTAVDKVPLDSISPIINYDDSLDNFYDDLDITIDFRIRISIDRNFPGTGGSIHSQGSAFYFCVRDASNAITWLGPGQVNFSAIGLTTMFVDIPPTTVNYTLKKGDRVYMFYVHGYINKDCTATSDEIKPSFFIELNQDNYIRVQAMSYPNRTSCKVHYVNETLAKITEVITNNRLWLYSDFYGRIDSFPYLASSDGCGSLKAITNGQFIRRLEDLKTVSTPPIMTLSWKDAWEGLNPIDNIGIGIEEDPSRPGFNRVRVEPFDFFYEDSVIFTCNDVNEIKVRARMDRFRSVFKFGYQKWESEAYSGIDEVLTKREYRSEHDFSRNTFEEHSSFIGSSYAWEVTRRQGIRDAYKAVAANSADNSITDFKYDNDTFIVCLYRTPMSDLAVEQNILDTPVNIINATSAYNFRITPNRNALKWLPQILAGYPNVFVGSAIYFNSGEGNFYAQGILAPGVFCNFEYNPVIENGLIDPNILDSSNPRPRLPIWDLEDVVFSYPMSLDEYVLINNNRHKLIAFNTTGLSGAGWIDEIIYSPEEGLADFTLIPKRTP